MNIRFATLTDKISVLHLLNQLGEAENEVRGYSPEHTKAHILGSSMYEEVMNDKNTKIFLAEANNEIVGVATLFLIPYIRYGKMRGYITDLVVEKSMRGKSVGTELINAIKNFCRTKKINRIKVDTGLPDAKKFYAKNGGIISTEMFTFTIDDIGEH